MAGCGNELAKHKEYSLEERRKQIFAFYVEQMFQRIGSSSLAFPKEKSIGWLSWLAGKMREHSQTVFLVEGLQPSWLDTRAKRAAYGTVVALSLALIVELPFGLFCFYIFGLNENLSVGLVIFSIAFVGVGLGCWSKSPLKNGVLSGSIGGLLGGLLGGLITA